MSRFADKVAPHHQQRVDRFVNSRGTQRVAGQRFGGRDRRALVAKHFAQRADFFHIPHRGRSRVRIDIIDRRVHALERHRHAAHGPFARRLDHAETVGGGPVADQFGDDLRAAGLGVFEFFQNQDAAPPGNHKPIAVDVVSPRSNRRGVIVFRRHGPHAVEQHREGPIELFPSAGDHHILLAPLNQLGGVADAMRRRGTRRANRIIPTANAIVRREHRRTRARHGFRHHRGTNLLGPLFARDVRRAHNHAGGRSAGTHDQTGPFVLEILVFQPGMSDRFFHRQKGVSGCVAHEAARLDIDRGFEIELEAPFDLAAETKFGILRRGNDPALRFSQRGGNLFGIVTNARNDSQSGDNHAPFHAFP